MISSDTVQVTEYYAGTGRYELYLNERVIEDDSVVVVEQCTPGTATAAITDFEIRNDGTASVLVRTDGAVWGSGYLYTVTYSRPVIV